LVASGGWQVYVTNEVRDWIDSLWYREAIPLAEHRYERYLKERLDEEEQQR
jgi:hypothetical protein